jgi:hypothetical protein
MREVILPPGFSSRLKAARLVTLFVSGLLLLAWLIGAILWWRSMVVDLDPLLTATFFEQVTVVEVRAGAADLAVSPALFPALWFGLEVIVLLTFATMSLLLFWRKPDGFGTYLALAFMIIATSITGPVITRVDALIPGWTAVVYDRLLGIVSFLALISIAYLFPDGRFVPRWTRWVLLIISGLFVVYAFVWTALPEETVDWAELVIPLTLLGFGVASQIYRYVRVSGPIERQQLKGVIVSLALFLTVGIATSFVAPNAQSFVEPATAYDLVAHMVYYYALTIATVGLIAAITFAVLRYRLWEIDVFIRRTTTYAAVTGLLVLVYFGTVVVLQRLFTSITGQTSTIAIVVSTLLIAALFLPLRQSVQDAIDRRFFRRKYDAEKVLNAFAATVRDETDLDALTAELVRVIQETMQPEFVSVWLASTDQPGPSSDAHRPDYNPARQVSQT